MPALVKQQQKKKKKKRHSFVCNHTNQINIYGSKVGFYTLAASSEPLYIPCIDIYYNVQ